MDRQTSPAGQVSLVSTLTCPHCGQQSEHRMPEDTCQFFLPCPACSQSVRPLAGDCCVFCSYGSVPCPPVQIEDQGRSNIGLR